MTYVVVTNMVGQYIVHSPDCGHLFTGRNPRTHFQTTFVLPQHYVTCAHCHGLGRRDDVDARARAVHTHSS